MHRPPGPVTADDVLAAVASAAVALRAGADRDWWAPAGDLDWPCWETVEHIADDLVFYGAQLGAPGHHGYLPLEAVARRPGAEANVIRADPAAGPDGLLAVLTASAALLAAIVRVTPPDVTGHHSFGPADPEATAAMGVLETLVHTRDVAQGLGVPFDPDPGLCERVLARLLPDVEPAADPWTTLLWACGRIALPGRPRREGWRWDNAARHPRPAQRIGLVTLVVPDHDEAIAFYVDTVEFTLVEDTALGDGTRWVVVAPPGGRGASLLLTRTEPAADRATLSLSTSDVAADHTRLLAAGVTFLEAPHHEPHGPVAVFTDPFGTTWDLIQNGSA